MQTVGPGADRDLLEANAVPFGERGAQAVRAAVRVAVQARRRSAADRLERLRERAERPFVRGELDDALEPELALHLLDRLARLVRDDPASAGREKPAGTSPLRARRRLVRTSCARTRARLPPPRASRRIAPLFNPACSPVPGTAARALPLPGTSSRPSRRPSRALAFRRLMIPIWSPFRRSEPTKHPFPIRDRAHA